VVGRREGSRPGPCVHFNGHLDVVQTGAGWTVDPFEGVVRDGKFRGYRAEVNPCFYLPLKQWYGNLINLEVRVAGNPSSLAPTVRRAIQGLDRDLIVPEIQTLRSFRDAGLAQERLQAALLSGLGILALLIAAVGLYGVLAFAVAQRTREIGVRMALGADANRVVRDILSRAMALVGAGLAIGLAAALPLAKSISALLYGVSAAEPEVYAVAAGILALALQSSGYLAETFRAGFEGLPKGQREAADAIGTGRWRTIWRVEVPQVALVTAPMVINQLAVVVKSSTLVSVIAIADLMYAGLKIVNQWYEPIEVLTTIALAYFVLIFAISGVANYAYVHFQTKFGLVAQR